MKLTILVDNTTIIDRYFLGEPGVSFFMEEAGKSILFDVGYSDIFIRNAQKLGIDLYSVDYVAVSHGHIDHTWGFMPLISLYNEAVIEKRGYNRPVLLAHNNAFERKRYGNEAIGSLADEKLLGDYFDMRLGREPFWITEKMVFLGEIERTNSFENKKPVGKRINNGAEEDDYVLDDTALAYKSAEGLVIITGCSHSGICNIIEQARRVCKEDRIADVIGGFHLLSPEREQLEQTRDYMKYVGVKELHACHCTDFGSRLVLSEAAEIKETGVGLVLEYY